MCNNLERCLDVKKMIINKRIQRNVTEACLEAMMDIN